MRLLLYNSFACGYICNIISYKQNCWIINYCFDSFARCTLKAMKLFILLLSIFRQFLPHYNKDTIQCYSVSECWQSDRFFEYVLLHYIRSEPEHIFCTFNSYLYLLYDELLMSLTCFSVRLLVYFSVFLLKVIIY